MLVEFTKMQAQGNDFVILNYISEPLPLEQPDFAAMARWVCHRHFGIGADGLVLMQSTEQAADSAMIIYNADGSRAELCGSALRCVAGLLSQYYAQNFIRIATDSGIKTAQVDKDTVNVNMGKPRMLKERLKVGDFEGDLVDIGNRHYIVWQDDLEGDPHLKYGSILEQAKVFEQPVNVHFVRKHNAGQIEMKIWERGCGATLACGTGATSTVFSGIKRQKLQNEVQVLMPGGQIEITFQPETEELLLSGSVSVSFEGKFRWKI